MVETTPQASRRFYAVNVITYFPQVVIAFYLFITLLIFIYIPFSATDWLDKHIEFTPGALPGALYLPGFIGLVFLASSLWIFTVRRTQIFGLAFALFCTSVALACVTLFDFSTSHGLNFVWSLSIPLAGAALMQLALTFPRPYRQVLRFPSLTWAGYLPALALFVLDFLFVNNQILLTSLLHIGYWYASLAIVFFFTWNSFNYFNTTSPFEKVLERLILIASACAFLPLSTWLILRLFFPGVAYSPLLLIPLVIFPLMVGYTVQQNRLLRTEYILSRTVLYFIMAVLVAGGYALVVSGVSIILTGRISTNNPIITGIILFLLALSFNPVREYLQRLIDRLFFRGEQILQEKLQAFSHELSEASDISSIQKLLRRFIEQSIGPSRLHFFIYNPASGQYAAFADESGQPTSDIIFTSDSALVKVLQLHQSPLFYSPKESSPGGLEKDRQRLNILAAQLYIPMPGRQQLSGWIALGPPRSAESYSASDMRFLETIGNQSALAVERVQVIANMEQRVLEMRVLSRLALGINVTVNLDDILELIYAQTNLLIPTRDFYLALSDDQSSNFQYAFYLENNERLPEKEARPQNEQATLEQEIIRSRRAILTGDHQNECRKRGILPSNSNLFAWMGVPLNSGAETIGAISLGSRDPGISFSADQLNLLQSIADQTAGGIVKIKLLQETERRARQLSMLNQVTQQLTSTLETETLLQNILQNAVDMLNCEGGSLLLLDQQTEELVFRAVVEPVTTDLIDKRMAPGTGIAGKAYKTRQPVMVNNCLLSGEEICNPYEMTGVKPLALLAVPLEVKDDVIGVIEIVNRRDGQPFTSDDQSLLAAYAGQASIAFENARLYTLTDQALADRVEELSVMQRIDRELNTSLDISKAMNITLDWAMRQSKANAGLVGIIEENGILIMASQGYTTELDPFKNAPLPMELPLFQAAIQTGQLQQVDITNDETIRTSLLTGSTYQVIVPIRRETAAVGIILLESTSSDPLTEETSSFLNRLSDHAAIAISNAQLYSVVQAANIAKSEFVSFVSHELKNPMTSIKGYTELLAAGAVGAVNEAQANFLSTIRSNVERMSTLVSDLADVSRIEAGRLRLDFKAINVNENIEEVIRSLRRQVDEKQQLLLQEVPDFLPQVWGDRIRLNQVLTNLLNNAIKYTPANGKVIIGAESSQNRWNSSGPPNVVHIWIKDNGIGITAEDQARIFQKFFRSDDPKARESPGTGLGLNITKSLIEMQGGQIWFESEFRMGTVFHFTIPVAE